VIYQELDDLVSAVVDHQSHIDRTCNACFSGNYPTGDVTPRMLLEIEEERIVQGK